MDINEAIAKLKKRNEKIAGKSSSGVSSQINALNNNIVGAIADIADVFIQEKKKEAEQGLGPIIKGFASMIGKEMPTPKIDTTNMDMTMMDVKDSIKEMAKNGLSPKLQAEIIRLQGAIIEVRNAVTNLSKKDMVKIANQIDLGRVEKLLSELVKAYNAPKTATKEKDDTLLIDELKKLSETILSSRVTGVRVLNPGDFPVSPSKTAFKAADGTVSDGLVDSDHHVQVDVLTLPSVTIDAGDIEIGAVEIKDSSTNTRATVGANGLHVEVTAISGDIATASNQNPADAYTTNNIDEASATVTYIGMEEKAGAWYVKKIDTSSGNSFGHATVTNNGSYATYSAAWTARASLTYNNFKDAL